MQTSTPDLPGRHGSPGEQTLTLVGVLAELDATWPRRFAATMMTGSDRPTLVVTELPTGRSAHLMACDGAKAVTWGLMHQAAARTASGALAAWFDSQRARLNPDPPEGT